MDDIVYRTKRHVLILIVLQPRFQVIVYFVMLIESSDNKYNTTTCTEYLETVNYYTTTII